MSPPRAYVAHRARGRLRLRVPERRNDAGYFETLAAALRGVRGVREVSANPGTGSVVLRVEDDSEDGSLLGPAVREGLFELHEEPGPPRDTPLSGIARALSGVGASLQSRTEGRWDLSSLSFYALVGAGLYQLARGKFMPAGGALLITAINLVNREADRQRQDG